MDKPYQLLKPYKRNSHSEFYPHGKQYSEKGMASIYDQHMKGIYDFKLIMSNHVHEEVKGLAKKLKTKKDLISE